MKDGRHSTVIFLLLAFAHNIRFGSSFTSPFTSHHHERGVVRTSSIKTKPLPSQDHHQYQYHNNRHQCGRASLALCTTTSSDDVLSQEENLEAKAVARAKLKLERTKTLQQLIPELDAFLLVSKSPRFNSPSLRKFVPERIASMQKLLPQVNVLRLVRLNPQILLLDSKTIAPRIAFVKKMFPKSPKLLMRMPALLQRDPELSVLPKMKAIGELLPGMDILRLIRREPTILSLDVERTIKPRLESLGELLPNQNVTSMINRAPRLLTSAVPGMAQKISSLRWLLGPDANLEKILTRRPELMISNIETTVAAKFRCLENLFPTADAVKMVESDASVLFYDYQKGVNVKVDCWQERTSNVTGLIELIQGYPMMLSYSLDTSVSRFDYLIEAQGMGKISPAKMRVFARIAKKDWHATYGAHYRKFLEKKVEGPSILKLWPGLYFDSDPVNKNDGPNKKVAGKNEAVRIENDGSVSSSEDEIANNSASAVAAEIVELKNLEKQYGAIIKDAQLRFSPALRNAKYGANPTEMDMILYDIKSIDKQVRKVATGPRRKDFFKLLPGVDVDKVFSDYPKVFMMDLKKVKEKVTALRKLLPKMDIAGAVSNGPELLLNDVSTCLRPRMTRLRVALSKTQFEGVFNEYQINSMVVRCPQLLLSDVRNVVVPSLEYFLRCTFDHKDLGRRLLKDPGLLVLGVGPLARVQFSLEQHRDGSTAFSMKDVGPAQRAKVQQKKTVAKGGAAERKKGKGNARDDSRLLPPVVLPQLLKCQLRDFVERNPEYLSFLAERQGLRKTAFISNGVVSIVDGSTDLTKAMSTSNQATGNSAAAAAAAAAGCDIGTFDRGGQVVFWERAIGTRLAEMFRPVDSPYTRMGKTTKEGNRKGLDGQKLAPLSELDLLVGDVLYFNHRIGVLLKSKLPGKMISAMNLGDEATKLAEDVHWGSRQIQKVLGLGALTEELKDEGEGEKDEGAPTSEQSTNNKALAKNAGDLYTSSNSDTPLKPADSNKRTWVEETFRNFWQYAGGGSGERDQGVPGAIKAVVEGGKKSQKTAEELERLLGEVSTSKGLLEGLLNMPTESITPDDGDARGAVEDVEDPGKSKKL